MRIQIIILLFFECAISGMDNRRIHTIQRKIRRKTNKQLIKRALKQYCRPAPGKTFLLTLEQRIKSWRWCNKDLAELFLQEPSRPVAPKDISQKIKEIKAILKTSKKDEFMICTWQELKNFLEFVYAVDANYPDSYTIMI